MIAGFSIGLSFIPSASALLASEVKYARGSHVWVVEAGAYDEHYIVRYVMNLPGGAD